MVRVVQKDWIPCPRGELGRLTGRLRVRRRLRMLLSGAAVLVASAIAYGGFQLVVALTGPPGSTATSCHPSNTSSRTPAEAYPSTDP